MEENDPPIEYIKRTREYYWALGYGAPYVWAAFDDVPFQLLKKPLNESVVALVTTAAPFRAENGDQGPGAPYNSAAKFYEVYTGSTVEVPDLRISHIAIDRDHTTAEDQEAYFPLEAMRQAALEGRIGQLAEQFFGLPTNRSARTTLEVDAAALLARCKAEGVDVVILVPNCPVCHQSVSLAARVLEAGGIATVVMGAAKDIVEHVGVPRFVFSDFPLGNSAGRPHDPDSQRMILNLALDVLKNADGPRTTVQTPLKWNGAEAWKQDYSNAAKLSAEEIAHRKRAFDAAKSIAKQLRSGDAS